MELEIIEKKENPLLERTEVKFVATHPGEKTLTAKMAREGLSELMGTPKGKIIIHTMKAEFGKAETMGYAKVYKNEAQLLKVEQDHILKRNGVQMPSKKEGKPAEKAEAPEPAAEPEPEAPAEEEAEE